MPDLKIYILVAVIVLAAVVIILGVVDSYAYQVDEPYMPGIEFYFYAAAEEFEIDPAVLRAIAVVESGFGTSDLAQKKNNWFGWRRNNGNYMSFDSAESCIQHVAQAIGKRPHGSVEDIAAWYCPGNAAEWSAAVREAMT